MPDDSKNLGKLASAQASSDMRLPPINQDALFRSFERNVDAFSQSMRIALQGAQTLAQRQMEFMQQAMVDFTDGVQAASGARQGDAPQSTEPFRRAYEHAVDNGRQLFDLMRRCNREALNPLHQRFAEAINELPALTRVE